MTTVRRATGRDRSEWLRMRAALWPESAAEHSNEIDAYLADSRGRTAVFVAERTGGDGLAGVVEVRLRDHADGCSSSPVAYVEGWYVDPGQRRTGVGGSLLEAVEDWSRGLGLTEVASDSELGNDVSRQAHLALGFEEVSRVVQFRKSLNSSASSSP